MRVERLSERRGRRRARARARELFRLRGERERERDARALMGIYAISSSAERFCMRSSYVTVSDGILAALALAESASISASRDARNPSLDLPSPKVSRLAAGFRESAASSRPDSVSEAGSSCVLRKAIRVRASCVLGHRGGRNPPHLSLAFPNAQGGIPQRASSSGAGLYSRPAPVACADSFGFSAESETYPNDRPVPRPTRETRRALARST